MAIPDDTIQEVRDRVDIVEVVGRYVELRRAGRNWKGLCPFHDERTPSFNVNPDRKGYKCFGCGAGGDAIRFVMDVEGKSFQEAVLKLAELCHVPIPRGAFGGSPASASEDERRRHERDEAYAILRAACEAYAAVLAREPAGEHGRRYLEARGLTAESVQGFRLGYAPAPAEGGWDTLVRTLRAASLPLPLAETLGLVGRSERTGNQYDKFRGRLMFPVIAPGNEVIAFSGRVVPPHDQVREGAEGDRPPPKYVNSPESLLFTKGKHLFGLANARAALRATRKALLVEGNVDVVKLHQWGHREAVAPLGTALTPEQARLLARFADEVVMCFDGDAAGKKAAWTALPLLLEAGLDVSIVLLPEGQDPDSVGEARFAALKDRARPALEELMVRIAAKAGDAAHARARGLDRVVPLIAKVRRDSARELLIERAAELFGWPAQRVESAVKNADRDAPAAPSDTSRPRPAEENSRRFPSISRGHVPPSAAVAGTAAVAARRGRPLPAGEAQLTMLLVDVPHLAGLAERSGVRECVTDERLAPIVRAVLDGAREGEDPTLPELLDLVPPADRRVVYRAVFSGQYRQPPAGRQPASGQAGAGRPEPGSVDPQALLFELVQRCKAEAIDRAIAELDRRIAGAQDEGYPERASTLAMQRLALRREQMTLRSS